MRLLRSIYFWACLVAPFPWYGFVKLYMEIDEPILSSALTTFGAWLISRMHYKAIIFVSCIFTLIDLYILFVSSPWYDIIFNSVQKI